MKLGYITLGKSDDLHEWSGLNFNIRTALAQAGFQIVPLDHLLTGWPLLLRLKRKLYWRVLRQTFAIERTERMAKAWARTVKHKIAMAEPLDGLFCTGTLPIAYLQVDLPITVWADATFHSLRKSYPEYSHYCSESIITGDRIDALAYRKVHTLCFASDWAASDAVKYYNIDPRKVFVVPFGANCDPVFASTDAMRQHIATKSGANWKFLWLGVDWNRKGGAFAVDVVQRLNEIGISSTLDVIGCSPPADIAALPFVKSYGFLSKADNIQKANLRTAMLNAHFMLLPTKAECFGLVFAEAAAFALPSISCNVGGVSTVIHDKTTGLLINATDSVLQCCSQIVQLITTPQLYQSMCYAAFDDYNTRLNWAVAASRVKELLIRMTHHASTSSDCRPT